MWNKPEADIFRDIAVAMKIPEYKIITESKSTNTGENVKLSYEVMKERNILPKKIILVQKPYMLRRTYATFMKQWPGDVNDITVCVTAPPIGLSEYACSDTGDLDDVINIMLGDLKRIELYPNKGFQIVQEIPDHIWNAYYQLCQMLGRNPDEKTYFQKR